MALRKQSTSNLGATNVANLTCKSRTEKLKNSDYCEFLVFVNFWLSYIYSILHSPTF